MKIIMVLILLFLYFGVVVGIAQVKSEYDIKKIPYQTEIKYFRFDLVFKVNLIFELNTASVEVIRENRKN